MGPTRFKHLPRLNQCTPQRDGGGSLLGLLEWADGEQAFNDRLIVPILGLLKDEFNAFGGFTSGQLE